MVDKEHVTPRRLMEVFDERAQKRRVDFANKLLKDAETAYEALEGEVRTPETKEETEFLNALTVASRLLSDIENDEVRKVIAFEKGRSGWFYSYCNVNAADIVEALAPLWMNARTAVKED